MIAARQLFQTTAVRAFSIITAAVLLTSLPAAGISATSYAQANQTKQSDQQGQPAEQNKENKDEMKVTVTADVTSDDNAQKPQQTQAPTPTVSVTSSAPAGSINGPAASADTKATTPGEPNTADDAAKAVSTKNASTPTSKDSATPKQAGTTQQTSVTNNTDSAASSGNASVLENKKAGDATSGDASANATVVTVVGTGTGLGNAPITFVQNVYNTSGSNEIQGNITIDPNSLALAGSSSGNQLKLTQGSIGMTDIENNITLDATSGNATVANNGQAGDATSGDAVALANIINLVNSSVGSGRSFLGVVNIFGNLKGDILVPASFVNNLFASNAPAGTDAGTTAAGLPSYTSGTTSITNNVDLNAVSGTASVSNNGSAGDATSGDAMTNLTVFNLTGREVVAKNSLLVFVNVMGKWVGMIVNAPAGSTAAALSSGDVASSGASTSVPVPGDHQNQTTITNNVSVNAASGNASVSGNGEAGDATSGSAKAGANILNFVHSSFNLDDWFGALFINVIGSWLGNFGIADDAPSPSAGTPGQPSTPNPAPATSDAIRAVRAFQFNDDASFTAAPANPTPEETPPATDGDDSRTDVNDAQLASTASTDSSDSDGNVLGAATTSQPPLLSQLFGGNDMTSLVTLAAGIALLAGLTVVINRSHRHGA